MLVLTLSVAGFVCYFVRRSLPGQSVFPKEYSAHEKSYNEVFAWKVEKCIIFHMTSSVLVAKGPV